MRSLMWFRADLRVTDNPALHRACAESMCGVTAVFIVCPLQWRTHDWADIKVDFLLRNVQRLSEELSALRIPLLVRESPSLAGVPELLLQLALKHECGSLYFNQEHEFDERHRDRAVCDLFTRNGLAVHSLIDQTILPPGAVRTRTGDFYSVFSPYRKSWIARVEAQGDPRLVGKPKRQADLIVKPNPVPHQIDGFERQDGWANLWPGGEREARTRLKKFIDQRIGAYKEKRDFPAVDGTSILSPYLTVGAISMRQCLVRAWEANGKSLDGKQSGAATWINELIWREFYRQVMVGWPRVCMGQAFRPETEKINWNNDDKSFEAWCKGHTGVPIVDAAMRQLNETGWMHNRLRMIAAMFLTKDLFIDWRKGERYFMRHLIDGNLASNNGGWQWAASTGTDAAPYFRIFNPFSQSQRFDPQGDFIRKWVPELKDVKGKAIHDPRALGKHDRSTSDHLGYPPPIADHHRARVHAIESFKNLKKPSKA